jgi:hypothetical protein
MTILGNNTWRIYAMEELFIFKYKTTRKRRGRR